MPSKCPFLFLFIPVRFRDPCASPGAIVLAKRAWLSAHFPFPFVCPVSSSLGRRGWFDLSITLSNIEKLVGINNGKVWQLVADQAGGAESRARHGNELS